MEGLTNDTMMVMESSVRGRKLKYAKAPNHVPWGLNRMEKRFTRVLVVDDDTGVQDMLSKVLSAMGFEVTVAKSGKEGLHLFLKNPAELVLTDMNMPGMDGSTLATHIKEESPNTPVVLITGLEEGTVIENLKRSCVDSIILKPFELTDIQNTVLGILGNRILD